jgi:hypothetical protein
MRKTDYVAMGSQESFIVPLLAREVAYRLDQVTSLIAKEDVSTILCALDCGCGNQPFKRSILSHGFQYESLDVTQNSYGNVSYICNLDVPTSAFRSIVKKNYSLVLVTEVLEHVSDWYAAFANISESLALGGYALITAPFFYPLHEEPHDYCRPTIHQFEKVAQSVGLKVVSISKCGDSVDVVGTVLGAGLIRYTSPYRSFNRIINFAIQRFQKYIFKTLLDHRTHFVSDCESIYLSNVVVLKKDSRK